MNTWKRMLLGPAVAAAAVTAAATSAEAAATDTVKFNQPETNFAAAFLPNGDPGVPGFLTWTYDTAANNWTARLVGQLNVVGMAPGDCSRLTLRLYDNGLWQGSDVVQLCSNNYFLTQVVGVDLDVTNLNLDEAYITLETYTGAGWTTVATKTRLNN